jgi:hypothetical protein
MKREAQFVICVGNKGYPLRWSCARFIRSSRTKERLEFVRFASLMSPAKTICTRRTISRQRFEGDMDTLSRKERSQRMSLIRNRDTKPELFVRQRTPERKH